MNEIIKIDPDVERVARTLCLNSGIGTEAMLVDANHPYHTRCNQVGAVIFMNAYNQPKPAWKFFVQDAELIVRELRTRPLISDGTVIPDEPKELISPELPGFNATPDAPPVEESWQGRSGLR